MYMKAINKILLSFIAIVFFQTNLWSQQGAWKLNPEYSVAIPIGGLKNLTDKTSLRGWNVSAMYGITDQASVGLSTGFQDFYQKYPRAIFHEPGSDLSAVITNSIQVIPVMLKAKYQFSQQGFIQPYASVAAGGNFIQYQKYYGQFVDSRSKFGFAAQPELGINIPVGEFKRTGINVAAAYNFMPFKYNDADGLNHISVKAGINIPLQR
jgi:outer membrane protein W